MFEQISSKIYIVLGIIGFFLLYRLLNKPNTELQREMDEILTNEKYQVKGQYDSMKNT